MHVVVLVWQSLSLFFTQAFRQGGAFSFYFNLANVCVCACELNLMLLKSKVFPAGL